MEEVYQKVFEGLVRRIRRYNQSMDVALLRKAFEFSYEAHRNQLRKSGHKYFEHPLEVAKILTGLKMDYETIAAAILHDVAEDTEYNIARVESGSATASPGCRRGHQYLRYQAARVRGAAAENFRKIAPLMVKDIRGS